MTLKEIFTLLFICITLIITSFILQIGLYPFVSDTIIDYRSTKEFLTLVCVIGIILWSIFAHHKIRCSNPGILFLVGYILIHPFLTPQYDLIVFQQNVAGFWQFKPVLYSMVYFLLFCVVSNLRLHKIAYDIFFKVLYWIGFLSAIYVLIQYFNLDEFQRLASWGDAPWTTHGNLAATFTHPNYSSALVALTIPFGLYLKKYWQSIFMFIILLLINSKMAIFGFSCGLGYYIFSKNKLLSLIYFISLIVGGSILIHYNPTDWTASGRYEVWSLLFHDITNPWISEKAFPLFGHGLGSFGTIWTSFHQSKMHEAHNEFLQYWFEAGLVGVLLVIFSIFWLIKRLKLSILTDSQTVILFASFVVILACSSGLFIWQIEPHRFISVLIFGLLHNKVNQQGRIRQ